MFLITLVLEVFDIAVSVVQKCDGFIFRCSFDHMAVNINTETGHNFDPQKLLLETHA
jgi:hypothetical protein